jgi:hypothetical protein
MLMCLVSKVAGGLTWFHLLIQQDLHEEHAFKDPWVAECEKVPDCKVELAEAASYSFEQGLLTNWGQQKQFITIAMALLGAGAGRGLLRAWPLVLIYTAHFTITMLLYLGPSSSFNCGYVLGCDVRTQGKWIPTAVVLKRALALGVPPRTLPAEGGNRFPLHVAAVFVCALASLWLFFCTSAWLIGRYHATLDGLCRRRAKRCDRSRESNSCKTVREARLASRATTNSAGRLDADGERAFLSRES